MIRCPNCKNVTLDEARVCPNCGAILDATQIVTTPPGGVRQRSSRERVPREPLRGLNDWLAATGGFLVGLASPLFFLVGFLLAIAIYFSGDAQERNRPFRRGLGWGLVALVLITLGLFVTCLFSLRNLNIR